ncbi:MAG: hypothetical protein NVSMB1_10700 [Polyangiales bacterium]
MLFRSTRILRALARRTLPSSALLSMSAALAMGCSAHHASESRPRSLSQGLIDRGPVTLTIDVAKPLGKVVTGGGTVFTGFSNYVIDANRATAQLAAIPHKLNRVHFSGETPDRSFRTIDRAEAQFPQPNPPPAAWNLTWSDGAVKSAKLIRDAGGADFIMSIHNAPTWMSKSGPGTAPKSNATYAQYCARLVAYYNKGQFTDDAGVVVKNPDGITGINYWETWNEPDINDFGNTTTPAFSPSEFAAMYKEASAAMRAVDPTIKVGGPNTISDSSDTLDYINTLLSSGAQVDFVAYHQYQANTAQSDQTAFVTGSKVIAQPTTTLPIFISETNTDSEDNQSRTGHAFEWAGMPLEYKAHVEAGTSRVIRWETYENNYNLIDATKGKPVTTYWSERGFWEAVTEGSTRVSCVSSSADVECLAVVLKTGALHVVAINKGVADPADFDGTGVLHTISIQEVSPPSKARAFLAQAVDRNTVPEIGPALTSGPASTITIDGYGLATFIESSSGACTPVTCAARGKNCGTITDGCGAVLSCGSCVPTDACFDNVCAASVKTDTIVCNALQVTNGSLGGAASSACSGDDPALAKADSTDTRDNSVTWNAANNEGPTSAYASYVLPVDAAKVKKLSLLVRYRGDDASEPKWTWSARNAATGAWETVTDNGFAGSWVWSTNTTEIAVPTQFIDASRTVAIRFTTDSNTNSAEIDQLVLRVIY